MGHIEDGDTPTNQPVEAKIDFRNGNNFKHQHEEMRKKIRKFVTFKSQGKGEDDHQEGKNNKDADLPPPPVDWETSSGYEQASLLSVKAEIHEGASDSYLEPLETTRPRLKISRLPPPVSSQPSTTPGHSTPPTPASSGAGTPRRVKKPPPAPPNV